MSDISRISLQKITDYLKQKYGHIEEIQVFSESEAKIVVKFVYAGEDKIFRIRKDISPFLKDRLVWKKLGHYIPVPKVDRIGSYKQGEYYYCISDFIQGVPITNYYEENRELMIKKTVNYLNKLHQFESVEISGYGDWAVDIEDQFGNGKYSSMKEFILSTVNKPDQQESSKISESDWNLIYINLQDNIDNLSSLQSILHGDYGYTNVLINNDQISGIIDWEFSRIGDPAYDLAWLQLWGNDLYLYHALHSAYDINQIIPETLKSRLICYLSYHALSSLNYFIANNKNQSSGYLLRLYHKGLKMISEYF